jgi:hypothetical protein
MKRAIITGLAVLAAWWGATNQASAQFGVLGQPPIRSRPTVSPYVNLGIGGGGALNYYGIVRPQTLGNEAMLRMQQNLNQLNADGSPKSPQASKDGQAAGQTGLQTGHTATFFNTGHYYPPQTSARGQMGPSLGFGNTLGGGGLGLGLGGGGFGLGGGGIFGGAFNNAFPR